MEPWLIRAIGCIRAWGAVPRCACDHASLVAHVGGMTGPSRRGMGVEKWLQKRPFHRPNFNGKSRFGCPCPFALFVAYWRTPSAGPRPKARAHSHMLRVSRPAMRGNTALAHAYELDTEPQAELIDNVIPLGQRRSLLELTEETCRWPIGDPGAPDFFFCGGQTVSSLPYCAFHARLAYQPPNARRDRRPFKA